MEGNSHSAESKRVKSSGQLWARRDEEGAGNWSAEWPHWLSCCLANGSFLGGGGRPAPSPQCLGTMQDARSDSAS